MNRSHHPLTKAWRAVALGGLFFSAASAAQAQDRASQREELSGRLVDVSVVDADYQRPLPIYGHRGRHYVAGAPGQPLGDGAGRAQAREGPGAAPESDALELAELQARLVQQRHQAGDQRHRRGPAALAVVQALLPGAVDVVPAHPQ